MKPKVLYVAGISSFIEPKNGGQIRTHAVLKQICTQFEVDIFSPYLPNQLEGNGIRIASNICPESLKRLLRWGSRRGFSRLIDGYLRRKGENSEHPLQNDQFHERRILENLIQTNHHQYQYIFFDTSRYAPLSPSSDIRDKSLLLAHNVDSVLDHTSSFHPRFEACLDNLFHTVITCTEQDANRFQVTSPNINCIVWPNGTSRPTKQVKQDFKYDVLFVGSLDYQPNIDAAHFLIEEVLPLLKPKGVNLCIAGRNPSAELSVIIQSSGINLIQNAPDLSAIYSQSKVAVVPLFTGSGSRLKIAEALIHGLPVISTALGAEGYPDEHKGLTRTECFPVERFIQAVESELKSMNAKKREDTSLAAAPFLWSNTIDLSKLPQ